MNCTVINDIFVEKIMYTSKGLQNCY